MTKKKTIEKSNELCSSSLWLCGVKLSKFLKFFFFVGEGGDFFHFYSLISHVLEKISSFP